MAKHKQDTSSQDERPPESTGADVAANPTEALVYGLSVEQFDALDRSLRMIAAHGDLLATVQATDLAAGTLPVIGQAIHDEAQGMHAVIVQVETQQLGRAADASAAAVEEARARYGAQGLRQPDGTRPSRSSRRSRRAAGHLELVREGGSPVRS